MFSSPIHNPHQHGIYDALHATAGVGVDFGAGDARNVSKTVTRTMANGQLASPQLVAIEFAVNMVKQKLPPARTYALHTEFEEALDDEHSQSPVDPFAEQYANIEAECATIRCKMQYIELKSIAREENTRARQLALAAVPSATTTMETPRYFYTAGTVQAPVMHIYVATYSTAGKRVLGTEQTVGLGIFFSALDVRNVCQHMFTTTHDDPDAFEVDAVGWALNWVATVRALTASRTPAPNRTAFHVHTDHRPLADRYAAGVPKKMARRGPLADMDKLLKDSPLQIRICYVPLEENKGANMLARSAMPKK